MGHGSGESQVVSPMPRGSNVVERMCGSKNGVWNRRQSLPREPPPATQTRSGPVPDCS